MIDSDGRPVTDFLEEFQVVTLDGRPVLSTWLMVPGHDHYCYTPCGNKPTFMQYLRKEIEMMVDAGAQGILIDEYDAHLHALYNAGCFCRDCMKGFRAYLQQHPSAELAPIDLEHFDYRTFLKERGYTDNDLLAAQGTRRLAIPLFRQFIEFNLGGRAQNVIDMRAYAKEYSLQQRGAAILVAANLFNCLPHSGPLRQYCDLVVGEKSNIQSRQDGFYRFGFAFMQGKQGAFIEDPNDHILQIIADLDNSRTDTYVHFMMEPLAQGFNGAIPYGGWLMNFKQDAFYPDMEVERQMGRWLKEHEALFPNAPVAATGLIYDLRSALETELFLGGHLDQAKEGGFRTFHDLTQSLCNAHVLYNVIYVSEDQPLTAERLRDYTKLIIPDAFSLRGAELAALRAWVADGGQAAAVGKVVPALADLRFSYAKFAELVAWCKAGGQLVEAEDIEAIGIGLHKREHGYVLHLVNYQLNSISRAIESVPRMHFQLAWTPDRVQVHSFPECAVTATIDGNRLTLRNIGIYTVVDLQ